MQPWLSWLICPQCGEQLPQSFTCTGCTKRYPSPGGVPRLFGPDFPDRERLDTGDGQAMAMGYRKPSRLLVGLRKIITSEYFPGKAWRSAKQRTLDHGAHCLVIGSGVTRYANGIHLDLDDFPGVDLVADAHRLPFRDSCLDAVLCEVVLEHVHQPARVIAETLRVLKPGGRCFFIAPFLFPFHGHPNDYRRWSKEGLAADFSAFSQAEIGIHAGPCSAMVNLLSDWAYVLSGLTFPRGYTLIKGGATALGFPLKYLDLFVNRFPEAHRLAATFYITACKPADPR